MVLFLKIGFFEKIFLRMSMNKFRKIENHTEYILFENSEIFAFKFFINMVLKFFSLEISRIFHEISKLIRVMK